MRRAEESITLAPAELQIMLTLVRAKGRTVRRAVRLINLRTRPIGADLLVEAEVARAGKSGHKLNR